ncbi:MAG: hypothetical protein M2R45_04191 [Verrucomicrobia subdivision 3 bacterium]|nr:hypothetical protein [Limisphaerales bacterium]MCS1417072.1 hypothetical protein [Limisphaerales bacterium]
MNDTSARTKFFLGTYSARLSHANGRAEEITL